jgi:hypothetical protein
VTTLDAPEAVSAAWNACEQHWDDTARHDALFALVAQHDCFAYAANRYKTRAGDAIADRQLERIRKAAIAKMMATGSARPDSHQKPFRATLALVVLLLVAAVAGLAYVANMHGAAPPPPPPPTPASH